MKLIINADDFGLSKSISDGIIYGIKEGYITSTSIMSNMPYAEYAIKQSIENGIDCIGLHVNLTVGKPVIYNNNLVNESGIFYYNKKQIENLNLTYEDVYNEIMGQIQKVIDYSNKKIKIDHLDTHHHLFENEIIRKVVIDISKKLNIPIRNENIDTVKCPDILIKEFTIKDVSVECIKSLILKYKSENIVVELMTHPGFVDEYTKSITSYVDREQEINVLKECKQIGLFDEIELINFKQF